MKTVPVPVPEAETRRFGLLATVGLGEEVTSIRRAQSVAKIVAPLGAPVAASTQQEGGRRLCACGKSAKGGRWLGVSVR